MNELHDNPTDFPEVDHIDQPDAFAVPLPDGVSGTNPGNNALVGGVDGDDTFGKLEEGAAEPGLLTGHDMLDDDLLPDAALSEAEHKDKIIAMQPDGTHDNLAVMDEFEQTTVVSPLEATTRVIPEDRWHEEPRYVLTYVPNANEPDTTEIEPGFGAIAPAFGERVINGEVQACSLEDMVVLHQEIATVLEDEHSHTAVLTDAPYPYHGTQGGSDASRANNDAWLIAIRNGHWSLPAHYTRLNPFDRDAEPIFDTELTRDMHDTADNHIAFMLLAPREMQDQITEAADHGITELLEAVDHPGHHGGLLLTGEKPDEADPLTYSWRGTSQREDINGMGMVDEISDEPSFIPVMRDLMALEGSEARQAYVQHYGELSAMSRDDRLTILKEAATQTHGAETQDDNELDRWVRREEMRAEYVGKQLLSIVAITNFNMRHREGRNMTEAEQAQARHAYAAGLVRVADKLMGDYVPQAA